MPDSTPTSSDLDLREYLRVLARRKWVVIGTAVLVLGGAIAFSLLQDPVYQARARLIVETSDESVFGSGQQRPDLVQTEVEVLRSEAVRDLVAEKLGRAPSVRAEALPASNVIVVVGESGIRRAAAEIANAYAEAYIEHRHTEAVDALLAAATQIQTKIDELEVEIAALNERIAADASLEDDLRPNREALVSQQIAFRERIDQIQVDSALTTGAARLATAARPPHDPVRPTPLRNILLALAVGPALGAALALLIEYFDDSIKTKDDFARATGGVAVLGLVPTLAAWRDTGEARLVTREDPHSPVSESYRSLHTSLRFLGLEKPIRILQVTSPVAQEGKTTTVANLGVVLAQAGLRVLLVDADLRRPRLDEFFDLDDSVGFTSVLLGEVGMSEAAQRVEGVEGLEVLPCGPLPPSPYDLLSSSRTAEVLASLAADWDLVVLDSAPVLPVADATVLSGWVDATLLVAGVGQTSRKHVHRAAEVLRQIEAPLVGAVLNRVEAEGAYVYAYGPRRYRQAKAAAGDALPSRQNETRRQRRRRRRALARAGGAVLTAPPVEVEEPITSAPEAQVEAEEPITLATEAPPEAEAEEPVTAAPEAGVEAWESPGAGAVVEAWRDAASVPAQHWRSPPEVEVAVDEPADATAAVSNPAPPPGSGGAPAGSGHPVRPVPGRDDDASPEPGEPGVHPTRDDGDGGSIDPSSSERTRGW